MTKAFRNLLPLAFSVIVACSGNHGDGELPVTESDPLLRKSLAASISHVRPTASGVVIDLGVLGESPNWVSGAYGINNRGTVVGHSSVYISPELVGLHAFKWTQAFGMVDLGTLGGQGSAAFDVNDADEVVGYAQLEDGSIHACIWDASGHAEDLATLGESSSVAYAINSRGQVVGLSGEGRAFIWDRAHGMRDLGTFGGNESVAQDINDHGQVVGSATGPDGFALPFIWTETDGLTPLDVLEDTIMGEALAINNAGHVIGYINQANRTVPVEWTEHGLVRLATMEGGTQPVPLGINARGTIVGWDWPDAGPTAVTWTSPRSVRQGPFLEGIATDINNKGQIVGQGSAIPGEGRSRALLWVPR